MKRLKVAIFNSENAYFNATRVSEFFGREKELNSFMRLKSTQEYIRVLEDDFKLITENSRNQNVKTHFVKE